MFESPSAMAISRLCYETNAYSSVAKTTAQGLGPFEAEIAFVNVDGANVVFAKLDA